MMFGEVSVSEVQAVAEEWAEARAAAAKAENDWNTGKPFLEGAIDARKQKIESLEAELAAAEAEADKNEAEQEESARGLEAARAWLETASHSLDEAVSLLQECRRRMPPRLSDSLDLSFATLADAKKPRSGRWQAVTVIFNRSEQFNHSIVKSEELLMMDGGEPRLVETLYWGMAQGYALDRAAEKAWRGAPGASAWEWAPIEQADAVADLLAIYSEEKDPEFVKLEAELPAGDAEK